MTGELSRRRKQEARAPTDGCAGAERDVMGDLALAWRWRCGYLAWHVTYRASRRKTIRASSRRGVLCRAAALLGIADADGAIWRPTMVLAFVSFS